MPTTSNGPVPCTRSLTEAEVESDYEDNTGRVIAETFRSRGLDPAAVPGVLCRSHGPFTWGKDPAQAVYHAAVLEQVARMALFTRQLNPCAAPRPPVCAGQALPAQARAGRLLRPAPGLSVFACRSSRACPDLRGGPGFCRPSRRGGRSRQFAAGNHIFLSPCAVFLPHLSIRCTKNTAAGAQYVARATFFVRQNILYYVCTRWQGVFFRPAAYPMPRRTDLFFVFSTYKEVSYVKNYAQWEGFEGRIWKEEVNVRDFIQKNYRPYDR